MHDLRAMMHMRVLWIVAVVTGLGGCGRKEEDGPAAYARAQRVAQRAAEVQYRVLEASFAAFEQTIPRLLAGHPYCPDGDAETLDTAEDGTFGTETEARLTDAMHASAMVGLSVHVLCGPEPDRHENLTLVQVAGRFDVGSQIREVTQMPYGRRTLGWGTTYDSVPMPVIVIEVEFPLTRGRVNVIALYRAQP